MSAATLEGKPGQQEPEAQLTPEQLYMLELQGIDPSSPEAQMYLQNGVPIEQVADYDPENPYSMMTREQAARDFEEREGLALEQAGRSERLSQLNAVAEAQKSHDVSKARTELEAIFGTETVVSATEKAIDKSTIATQNSQEVARAVAHGEDKLESEDKHIDMHAKDVANGVKAGRQYEKLKDKANGRAGHIVGHIADKADKNMRKLGVRKQRKQLETEAVEAKGELLTDTKTALEVEQELTGEAFVGALADNKSGISSARRKQVVESLKKSPAAMKRVAEAVRSYRKGNRDLKAYREAGEALEHHH